MLPYNCNCNSVSQPCFAAPELEKSQYQKPHFSLLGSLVFWLGLTFSQSSWSAPTVESSDRLNLSDWHEEIETSTPILEHSSQASADSSDVLSPPVAIPETVIDQDFCLRATDLNCNDATVSVTEPARSTDSQSQTEEPTEPYSPPPTVEPLPTPELESTPLENSSDLEPSATDEDPELGMLRLRELEPPPPPSETTVYLLGRVGYLRSDNLFSGIDPVDDSLFRLGVTVLAVPSLGPQTSAFAAVDGNIIRYSNAGELNYDELRFTAGIRQQLTRRTYGELGWFNRHLFTEERGDRFFKDHSLYLELGRRDSLAQQLTLDTFYQLRLSLADPNNRSQLVNTVGASLAYTPNPSLQLALDYQYALATFTQQDRQDDYHQLIARLSYRLSANSRIYLFGGQNFGGSSDPTINFDGLVLGVGVDFSVPLF